MNIFLSLFLKANTGFRQFDVDAHYRARARAAFNRLRLNPVFSRVLQNVRLEEPLDLIDFHLPQQLEIPQLEIPDYQHMPFGMKNFIT